MSIRSKHLELPSISHSTHKQRKLSVNPSSTRRDKTTPLKDKSISAFKKDTVTEITHSFHKKVEQAKEMCKRIHTILNGPPEELLTNRENKKQLSIIRKTQMTTNDANQYVFTETGENYRREIEKNLQWSGSPSLPSICKPRSKNKKFCIRQQTNELLALIEPSFNQNSEGPAKKILGALQVKQLMLKSKEDFKQNDGIMLYDRHKQLRALEIKEKLKQWKKKEIEIMRM